MHDAEVYPRLSAILRVMEIARGRCELQSRYDELHARGLTQSAVQDRSVL